MKIVETLLLGVIVTSCDLLFQALTHTQPITMTTTISLGQDKNSAGASQSLSTKIGYLGLTLNNNEIGKVFPQSPAEKAGLDVGDKIMEINDKSVYGLTGSGIADQLIGPPDSFVEIIVEHGNELRKLKLIRAEGVTEEAAMVVKEVKRSSLVESWTK
jgi:C-terminal processing protease CtpA/Prc